MPNVCASWRPKKGQAPPKTIPLQPSAAPMWSPDGRWLMIACQGGWGAVLFNTVGDASGFLIQEDPRLGPVRFSWLPWGSIAAHHTLGVHIWSVERQRMVGRWPVARQLACSEQHVALLQSTKITVYGGDDRIIFEVPITDLSEISFHGKWLYGWEGAAHSGKLWIWDLHGEGRIIEGSDVGHLKVHLGFTFLSPKAAVALWNPVLMQWHRQIDLKAADVTYRERTVQTIEGAKTKYELGSLNAKEDPEQRSPSLIAHSQDFVAVKHAAYPTVVWIISIHSLSICACLQHTQPITSLHFTGNLLAISCSTDQLFFWQPEGAHVIPLPANIQSKSAHWIKQVLMVETPTSSLCIAHSHF